MDWYNHKMFCEKIEREKQDKEQRCSLRNSIVSKTAVQNDGSVSKIGTIQNEQTEDRHVEKVTSTLADIKFE